MKVAITLSLDVDPEAWALIYGTSTKASDVRDSVRSFVLGSVQDSAAAQEGGITAARLGMANRDGGFRLHS